MDSLIKKENPDLVLTTASPPQIQSPNHVLIPQTTTSSLSSTNISDGNKRRRGSSDGSSKKMKAIQKYNGNNNVVPPGFLASMSAGGEEEVESPMPISVYYRNQEINDKGVVVAAPPVVARGCKQFWRAGDYEEVTGTDHSARSSVGMDHVRVHPRFLHSNATSHKWALGAFAELLDNALDEADNGATFVHVDVLKNQRDNSFMLLVEDNGGGMNPNKMRHCMSLGYSAKSKMANTIGQYGNGFKTSSMRLGADVIVFSSCKGEDENNSTLSVGLLSYTFLTATGQEDIVVPMVHFEKKGDGEWIKAGRTLEDWDATFEIILQWSPFATSQEFLNQFNLLETQGTRIIIYNLWEDDEDHLELDFDADPYDIQIRGTNKDEKMMKMARQFPSSRHFLTYKHSLRSYAGILYMKLPTGFRILLRGKEIEHHDIENDMKMVQDITYKPVSIAEGNGKNNRNMVATGKIGFVKDADHHIDVQGFNVYHKNRLIKPFWRVWNAAGSDGRGVIGILEANFIEPAHDKQGFERTTSLSRLEARLIVIQKAYWSTKCHEIGYAARRNVKYRGPSSSGPSNKTGGSSADGVKMPPSGIQRFPQVKPVVLTPQPQGERPPSQQNGSVGITSFASPIAVPSSVGSRPQIAPHLRKLDNIRNESNLVNPEVINSSNAGKHKTMGEMASILMKSLERERDIKQKLENQLNEKTKELATEKTKSEKLEKDIIALLDILQKEKDLNTKLENTLKISQGIQLIKEKTMEECKLERQY
ncbi:Histidine kinase- DNA gyrase B- and HSP90-like ATPase family protein [Euphorbia peplus]|nr:Histidine kinase- DNA gyrase B- and HSP90-like ATPase family protein [Euphorbia peplus]